MPNGAEIKLAVRGIPGTSDIPIGVAAVELEDEQEDWLVELSLTDRDLLLGELAYLVEQEIKRTIEWERMVERERLEELNS
jgi:hypothetical protein